MTVQNFDTQLNLYVQKIQKSMNDTFAVHYPNVPVPTVTTTSGPKYIRIVRDDGVQRSVLSFVERSSGLIWKPAGWKGPVKNFPRGSIYKREQEGEA